MRGHSIASTLQNSKYSVSSNGRLPHRFPTAPTRMAIIALVFTAVLCCAPRCADAKLSPAISVDEFLKCSSILPLKSRRVNVSTSEVVHTKSGRVQGFTQNICNWETVASFTGIPYAQPPVGELRFAPPKPVDSWPGVLNATRPANSCLQVSDSSSFGGHQGVLMWNVNSALSEDCLQLNIWTPTLKRKVGVLLWIFGGSYNSGTITLNVYDGATLAALFDVVVVTVNYRLGPLGFMYLGTPGIPGNMGLMDQQLALKWVHDNIGFFGGLPDRVTIMGESSGSVSIGLHLLIPESARLFRSAIMLSGAPLSEWGWTPPATTLDYSYQTARCAGCATTEPGALHACLMRVDPVRLTECQFEDYGGAKVKHFLKMAFTPTQDAIGFLSRDPHETLSDPAFLMNVIHPKRVLLGVTRNEGNYFLVNYVQPRLHNYQREFPNRSLTRAEFEDYVAKIYSEPNFRNNRCMMSSLLDAFYVDRLSEPEGTGPAAGGPWPSAGSGGTRPTTGPSMPNYLSVLDSVLGETQFKCPMIAMANALSTAGWTLYFYSFEERSRDNPWPKWMGVLHGYEIEFLLGAPALSDNYTIAERYLSHRMMTAWTNFINTEDPNRNSTGVVLLPGGAQWPPYSVRDEADVARRYFVLESGEEGPAATLSRSQSQGPASSSQSMQLPHRIGTRLGDRTCYFLTQQLPRVLRGAQTFSQTPFTKTRCSTERMGAITSGAAATTGIAQVAFALLISLFSTLFCNFLLVRWDRWERH